MLTVAAKLIGAVLSTISLAGTGTGVGVVFGCLIGVFVRGQVWFQEPASPIMETLIKLAPLLKDDVFVGALMFSFCWVLLYCINRVTLFIWDWFFNSKTDNNTSEVPNNHSNSNRQEGVAASGNSWGSESGDDKGGDKDKGKSKLEIWGKRIVVSLIFVLSSFFAWRLIFGANNMPNVPSVPSVPSVSPVSPVSSVPSLASPPRVNDPTVAPPVVYLPAGPDVNPVPLDAPFPSPDQATINGQAVDATNLRAFRDAQLHHIRVTEETIGRIGLDVGDPVPNDFVPLTPQNPGDQCGKPAYYMPQPADKIIPPSDPSGDKPRDFHFEVTQDSRTGTAGVEPVRPSYTNLAETYRQHLAVGTVAPGEMENRYGVSEVVDVFHFDSGWVATRKQPEVQDKAQPVYAASASSSSANSSSANSSSANSSSANSSSASSSSGDSGGSGDSFDCYVGSE